MTGEQIFLKNAIADAATARRMELRDRADDLWEERSQIIDDAIGRGCWLDGEYDAAEQLAQAAFDIGWLCDRLFRRSNRLPIFVGADAPKVYKCNGVFTS